MFCEFCSGSVIWQGPLANLTHTRCESCGRTNCQIEQGSAAVDRDCDCREDLENTRDALLTLIRVENGCRTLDSECTGWDAKKCGCALEARSLVKA